MAPFLAPLSPLLAPFSLETEVAVWQVSGQKADAVVSDLVVLVASAVDTELAQTSALE